MMTPNSIKSNNQVKVALIKSDLISDYEIEIIEKYVECLREEGTIIDLFSFDLKNEDPIVSDFDLFLCIHDDDVLNAVRKFNVLPPLLCIELPGDNSFFSQITLDSLKWALKKFTDKDYSLDSRSILQMKTGESSLNALNDVHITSSAINKRIRYDIRVNNESLYSDGSDSANAILISTPTGSTAMSFNLGGALINPQSPVFQIISIASRNITTHHQIIPQNSLIEIEIIDSVLPLIINVDNFQFKSIEKLFLLNKASGKISFINFIEKKNSIHPQNKLKAKLSFEDTQSLTSTAKFILFVLRTNKKPFSINELITTTHIQNQKTIRSALNLLISKGFIKRRENYTDMREYLYYYSKSESDS